MNDELIDVRTPLATSPGARVEIGREGVLHVLAGPITLHLDRERCEELTSTLARAMVALETLDRSRQPRLRVVARQRADAPKREAAAAASMTTPTIEKKG